MCEMRNDPPWLRQYEAFDSQGILFVHSVDQALAVGKAMEQCFSVVLGRVLLLCPYLLGDLEELTVRLREAFSQSVGVFLSY